MSAPEDKVDCKYGAPMGRGNGGPLLGKVRMRKVRLYDYDYDKGGAYWGFSATSDLYYATGDDGGYAYARGASREYAKAILLECGHITEDTRFYR